MVAMVEGVVAASIDRMLELLEKMDRNLIQYTQKWHGMMVPTQEKDPERTSEATAGVDGWLEGPIPTKGGALLTNSGSADRVTWLWHT